jgi:hypothetical protein
MTPFIALFVTTPEGLLPLGGGESSCGDSHCDWLAIFSIDLHDDLAKWTSIQMIESIR